MQLDWTDFMKGHPKAPTLGDFPLGLDDYLPEQWDQVGLLHDQITRGPNQQTIAVTGGWGSGKTSLMRLVKNRIDQDKEFPTVWFNIWRYEKDQELVPPLLLTIDSELRKSDWLGEERVQTVGKGLRALSRALLQGVTLRTGIVDFSGKDAVDAFFADGPGNDSVDLESGASLYYGFVSHLEGLVKQLGGERNQFRLVIFIDDVDRCQGPAMFRLMESMKLFFDIPGVVFVVGAAIQPLRQAVADHYGEKIDDDAVSRADLYVEKILPSQVKVVVPPSTLVSRFAEETQCPLLSGPRISGESWDSRSELAFSFESADSGEFYGLALAQFARQPRIESPRVLKMWLEAIDGLAHRFIRELMREVQMYGSEEGVLGPNAAISYAAICVELLFRALSRDEGANLLEPIRNGLEIDSRLGDGTDVFVEVLAYFTAPSTIVPWVGSEAGVRPAQKRIIRPE